MVNWMAFAGDLLSVAAGLLSLTATSRARATHRGPGTQRRARKPSHRRG